MIHISELARGYVKVANDVVKEGDQIEAKILTVDEQKRQIRLSMKALQPETVEPEKPAREPKAGRRAPVAQEPAEDAESTENAGPQLTAMEAAWQMAQDRASSKRKVSRAKRAKPTTSEREDILSRTLEKRLPTGA
jgi:predicted RNA-binding protein with RPS1 domain